MLGGVNIENEEKECLKKILNNLVYVRLTIVNSVKTIKPIYTIVLDYISNNEKIERLCNSYDDLGIALKCYYMFEKYLKEKEL